jgi:hypothetical protein
VWKPPPPKWHHADDEERARFHRVPYKDGRRAEVEFDSEEAFREDDEFHDAVVKVNCPHCLRVNAPLMSKKTAHVHSDWRWVGLDHKEPFSEYLCVCPACRLDYILTIYTPQ